ncbi:signal peptidase II [Thermicanus aegyptius]|uniref:signal peptidase II n=1 Tax=Thermicanus aegyptius TaxID=94009 RepID=UPI00048D020D|nr:signal peptidase II [Thermicanus aegyptius]
MFYYILLALLVFLLDQGSKWMVVHFMNYGDTIPLWPGVFHITSHRNAGAAFGILQNQRGLFLLITVVVVVGIVAVLWRLKGKNPLLSVALSLVLGGALGNFLDRLVAGEVVDFLDFRLIHYPIFNLADSSIVIGVGLILFDSLFSGGRRKNEKEEEPVN